MNKPTDASSEGTPRAPGGDAPRVLEIDLKTSVGRLRGNLAVPPGEMRLSELAWNAMALGQRLVDMAVKAETSRGLSVSCRKGCGACCRQAVPLSPPEAWMLADLVASFPAERRTQVLDRFARARARLEAEGFGSRSLGPDAGAEDILALGFDYFRLGIPCPFLEDESCSIHPHRPSSCREFLVTSAAEHCAVPEKRLMQAVPMPHSLTEALSRLAAMLLGGEPQVIPMTLALDWAAEHREAGRQRFDAALLMTSLVECLSTPAPPSDPPSC